MNINFYEKVMNYINTSDYFGIDDISDKRVEEIQNLYNFKGNYDKIQEYLYVNKSSIIVASKNENGILRNNIMFVDQNNNCRLQMETTVEELCSKFMFLSKNISNDVLSKFGSDIKKYTTLVYYNGNCFSNIETIKNKKNFVLNENVSLCLQNNNYDLLKHDNRRCDFVYDENGPILAMINGNVIGLDDYSKYAELYIDDVNIKHRIIYNEIESLIPHEIVKTSTLVKKK